MRIDIEVRSSGPGPRKVWNGASPTWAFGWTWTASRVIASRWTRWELDYKGRERLMCDGVAVTIRRA